MGKQNPARDQGNIVLDIYQNGLGEGDNFNDDIEDNSGWTEVVRGRSNKGRPARSSKCEIMKH